MRRRTKRTRLVPGPFIVLGLAVNLVAGCLFSPITAVRRVRIEGASPSDQVRLTKIVQRLRGVPCARVNAKAVESDALQNPEIRSASLSRTPFGSAVLHIARRTPVARLYGTALTGLSQEGVFYPATSLPDDLPFVELPDDYPKVGLTLGNAWRLTDVVRLAGLVRSIPAKTPVIIRLVRGGRLCLNIDSGVIDLGGYKQLEEKVAWVVKTLRAQPDFFATIATVNLVKLETPNYQPRKGVPNP